MTYSILNRRVGVMALAAAALMSLPSLASADHVLTSITQQMTYRIRAANDRMNHDVRAVNQWYRDALERARYEVEAARRNACNTTQRHYAERAYHARLAEIRHAFNDKLRAVRHRAEVERAAARRDFELARQQVRFERKVGVVGAGFVSGHPADCGCDRCSAARKRNDCSTDFCPTPFAPNVVPRNSEPWNSSPWYDRSRGFVPPTTPHAVPPTGPRLAPPTPDVRPGPPASGVRFNQQSPYVALLRMLMSR